MIRKTTSIAIVAGLILVIGIVIAKADPRAAQPQVKNFHTVEVKQHKRAGAGALVRKEEGFDDSEGFKVTGDKVRSAEVEKSAVKVGVPERVHGDVTTAEPKNKFAVYVKDGVREDVGFGVLVVRV